MQNLYIVWGKANELGIPIVDEQHRGIISTINSLHYFIQAGHGEEAIKPVLIMLEQYVDIHFSTEEELMAKANYPARDEHVGLHRKLVALTARLSLEASRDKDPDEILHVLRDWWLGHINKEDRKYAPALRKLMDGASS